ncbi:MAG: hypothetical protein ACKN9W_00750 [Methylococcus sp.]
MNRSKLYSALSTSALLAVYAFSSAAMASSVNYNLKGWPTGISSRVTLPPSWVPATNAPDYKGSLDVYWSVQIDGKNETQVVSKADAVAKGAPANFSLITLPDNCWGMNMNFGLIKLGQAADLTITVAADGSSMAPIFALYQGWDTGAGASRHDSIFFGENNPLGTTGLTYLGDAQNPTAKTTISKTFKGLAAGNYELFTTVASNSNPGGALKVTVKTTDGLGNQYQKVAALADVNNDGIMDQAVLVLNAGSYYLRTLNGASGKQIKQVLLGSEQTNTGSDISSAGSEISVLIERTVGGSLLRIYDSGTLALKKTLTLPK